MTFRDAEGTAGEVQNIDGQRHKFPIVRLVCEVTTLKSSEDGEDSKELVLRK